MTFEHSIMTSYNGVMQYFQGDFKYFLTREQFPIFKYYDVMLNLFLLLFFK